MHFRIAQSPRHGGAVRVASCDMIGVALPKKRQSTAIVTILKFLKPLGTAAYDASATASGAIIPEKVIQHHRKAQGRFGGTGTVPSVNRRFKILYDSGEEILRVSEPISMQTGNFMRNISGRKKGGGTPR